MGKNRDHLRGIQAIVDDLEREGLIKKNGEFRRARSGELQPVYAVTEKGRAVPDELRRRSIVH